MPSIFHASPAELRQSSLSGGSARGLRPFLLGLLLAPSLITATFAQSPVPKERPAEEDVVLLQVSLRGAEPSTVSVAGLLEGPPRGRPTGELVRDDLGHPIAIEVAILDREQSVVEVHLFEPSQVGDTGSDADRAGTPGAAGENKAKAVEAPIKLLLEPGIESAAELKGGETLWLELLSIGRQAPKPPPPPASAIDPIPGDTSAGGASAPESGLR